MKGDGMPQGRVGVAQLCLSLLRTLRGEDEVERATVRRGRRRLSHSGSSTYRRSVTCRINFLMIMIFIHT
jgi:hypothetical protein